MGGGDLNMKKSWHTGTFAHQERVWKKEKEALEERKKLQQLQKELEQERAVQELQRLQEAAGGKTREQRVDWMYAAPAEGSGPNPDELEAYLLGKKRVDKLLKGNEEKLLAAPSNDAPGSSFQSLQSANTARDTASKIREDPLLAIKRQEQLQYEKMLKDPRKRRELREARAGSAAANPSPSHRHEESKEERRARREARRAERASRHEARSGSGRRDTHRDDDDERDHYADKGSRSRHNHRSRSRSPRRDDRDRRRTYEDGYERPDRQGDSRRAAPPARSEARRDYYDERRSPPQSRHLYENSQTQNQPSSRRSIPPASEHVSKQSPAGPTQAAGEEERRQALAARLAAMQSSAETLSASRAERLVKMEEEDAMAKQREDEERKRRGDVGPRFLNQAQGQVFGGSMDLAERMKRSGRVGLVGDRD
ncbi:hypothetical protein JCM8115_001238 [Rhodotorula mucilaginosa]